MSVSVLSAVGGCYASVLFSDVLCVNVTLSWTKVFHDAPCYTNKQLSSLTTSPILGSGHVRVH